MALKLALLGLCILSSLAANPSLAISDTDILNFVLNLECLEATYYSTAVNGFGLNATNLGGGPQAVGGGKGNLSPDLIKIATELANDEIDHVGDVRAKLGAAAVPCPAIDIGSSFEAIANQALGITGFYPYSNDTNFLLGAFLFEDVGVTAFYGAVPQLTQNDNLQLLAGILPVEAYHAAILRTLLYSMGLNIVEPYNIRVFDFVQALSNLRGKVGDGKDQGIVTPPADGQSTPYPFANLIPQDGKGIVFQRTPDEVLAIVYDGNSTQPGGFYPKGMTGVINGMSSNT